MSNEVFTAGDTVYTEDARECIYVSHQCDGHLVRAVLDLDDPSDGPSLGRPEVHWRVSKTPPKDRYSAEAAAAKAELDEMQAKLAWVRREVSALHAERTAAINTLAGHPQLQPIVEYIEGRLTHAAVFSGYGGEIRIVPLIDALRPNDERQSRDGYVRLLSLYGGKQGPAGPNHSYGDNLTWRISRYSDGSGNDNQMCILGPSEDVVRQRLQTFLDANWKNRGIWNEHTIVGWAESAIKLGLNVPAALAERVAEQDAMKRKNRIEQARKNLQSIRQQLDRAENELEQATAAIAACEAAP